MSMNMRVKMGAMRLSFRAAKMSSLKAIRLMFKSMEIIWLGGWVYPKMTARAVENAIPSSSEPVMFFPPNFRARSPSL